MPLWLIRRCHEAKVGGNAQRVLECLLKNNHEELPLGAYVVGGHIRYTSAEQIDDWLGAAPGTARRGEAELVRKGILSRTSTGHNGRVATFVLAASEDGSVPDSAHYDSASSVPDSTHYSPVANASPSSVRDSTPSSVRNPTHNRGSSVPDSTRHKEMFLKRNLKEIAHADQDISPATDAELKEHKALELALMSDSGTEEDRARYNELHPKCMRRKQLQMKGGEDK